ncbi:MAG: class I SAM-dependent methyltransferase [Acidobacteriota bacterium]|jgi:predicted O-methyltransferase YrrM|nr:class I SAM-dependent methyltransferase [Acidobacteriota bacterium]
MTRLVFVLFFFFSSAIGFSNMQDNTQDLDRQVRKFMEEQRGKWRDLNVPEADGKALHDIIVQRGYTRALEIGTSTGYSGTWIAWALAKTGGKLITVEIDKYRYNEAVANFREAGLSKYVDARLGNAHEIVPALDGPFDFVFCDADKEWYVNYLKAVLPKLTKGGCFAAHNVSEQSGRGSGGFRSGRGGWGGENADYLEYARSVKSLETKILSISGSGGLAVSYKIN